MQKNKKVKTIKKERNFLESLVDVYLSLVFFGLPLIVTNGYYNITETKSNFFFAVSIMLISFFVLYIVFACFSKKAKDFLKRYTDKEISFIDISFIIFGGFILVSAVISEYTVDSWLGNSSRYQGAVTILVYIIMYFVVSRYYGNSQMFLIFAVLAFSIVCILGVLNCFDIEVLWFYNELPDNYKSAYVSTIGNINFYSSYICLIFPLVICGFCQTKEKLSVIVYSFALIVGAFGMMVTSSESFVVGFVVSMLLIPLFLTSDKEKLKKFLQSIVIIVVSTQIFKMMYSAAAEKNLEISKLLSILIKPYVAFIFLIICITVYFILEKNNIAIAVMRKGYITLLIVALISVGIAFALSNTVGLGGLDSYFRITDGWGTNRGLIWKQCLEAYSDFSFSEKLFGIGPESLYHIVETGDIFEGRSIDQAHNEYLQYLITTGAFGLLSYLSVIASVIFVVIKNLRTNTLAVGVFAALVSYWMQASVNIAQPFTTPIMYLYIAIIGGIYFLQRNNEENILKYSSEE